MDGITRNDRLVVIAATNQPNSVDTALRRPGRFDREVEIGIPTKEGRKEILQIYLKNMPHQLTPDQIQLVSDNLHGYVGADISQLCKQAALTSLKRNLRVSEFMNDLETNIPIPIFSGMSRDQLDSFENMKVTFHDFQQAMTEIRPSAMREIMVDIPTVRWSDIGGYDAVKQQLRESVEWPIKFPKKFLQFGIQPPRGILLYGPPGCSKTLMAKAVATEAGLNFIPVKGPELFSKYVGDSEKSVRDVFRKARAASPSVVFFDELDALAVERSSSDGTSVQDRVLSQMLNELDGITPLNNVVFLAATNRPDIIDKALMRPGRIDRILYIPPPDKGARRAIFHLHTKGMKLTDDVNFDSLTEITEGYSGAEIEQVCKEAALHALRVNFDVESVSSFDFAKALQLIPPRITPEQIQFYVNFNKSHGNFDSFGCEKILPKKKKKKKKKKSTLR
eukprot:TRINITY_DN5570_c0_g2_i4.p1 TRINITY_DN5570_c0_g2~~TRINITY_DN5570_c0_g2_i4.p1  ORF type:complete len:449 (-),score=98.50 TRINITY_DN5570_c0_g2_i4:171-1517(-)